MTMLEARAVSYAHADGTKALRDFSLHVEQGRRLALLGANGSGKTTALLHLNGTLRPSEGAVFFDGALQHYRRHDLLEWRKRVGLVLQDAEDQLFAASVAEDVSFGPLNLGLPAREVRQRVAEALAALDVEDLADRPPHMLSYGQKKRVAIAGAVAMRPSVLLLDEPTSGLDARGQDRLLLLLEHLHHAGTTLVFATHDSDLAYAFSDRAALLENGTVVAEGETLAVLTQRTVLERLGIRVPFLIDFAEAALKAGLLPPSAPFPRRRCDVARLLCPSRALSSDLV